MDPADAFSRSLDKVLPFYAAQGTPLRYRPRVRYVDQPDPNMPLTSAMVPDGITMAYYDARRVAEFRNKVMWRDVYGIPISDAAAAEVTLAASAHFGREPAIPDHYRNPDADIFLFPMYNTEMRKTGAAGDQIAAQLAWHLVEKQHGVLSDAPFIHGGTATYAAARFSGKACNTALAECHGIPFIELHDGAAYVVQRHLATAAHPFRTMLDRDERAVMQAEFLGQLRPVVADNMRQIYQNPALLAAGGLTHWQMPAFSHLHGNVTPEGLREAYRNLGCTTLADELEGRDMTFLVDVFRQFGF